MSGSGAPTGAAAGGTGHRPAPAAAGRPAAPGPGAARDFLEGLANSAIPPAALRLIVDALNAEPPPPASPAVLALLETASEDAMRDYYTRTRTG